MHEFCDFRPNPVESSTLPCCIVSFLCVFLPVLSALAESDPRPAAGKIDELVLAHLEKENIEPNPFVSDEQLVRRTYLAIIGRIPTIAEADRYLLSKEPDKHSSLIEELLANDAGYTAHHYQFWADLLRIPTGISFTLFYRMWVKEQIAHNTPYDEFVRKLVRGHGLMFDDPAASYYLRDAGMPLDNMSNTVRIFLGTRLECAQCHNHPFDKWTQKDYFRMAAYTFDFDVRMGATHDSNRQSIYRDLNGKAHEAYMRATGIAKFPFIPDEAGIADWLSQPHAPVFLQRNNFTEAQFREAAMRGFAARAEVIKFNQPILQSINMLYGHISDVQVRHREDFPLKLPHDYQYDDGSPGDLVTPGTMFGNEIPVQKDPVARKNAYADWLTSPENPRFTRVIVNRLWKRAFGHGLFEPVDDLTDHTLITNPELLSFLENLMRELNYDIRAFQKVLFHTELFRREVYREDHLMGAAFHFSGPLMKRMSAEQIWDSVTTLVIPNVDTYAPNRQKILDRMARNRAIFQSLEGRPFEEVLPRIREAGDQRRQLRGEQAEYEKRISAAYAAGDNDLAKKLTTELQEKVRDLERRNANLVFVDLQNGRASEPVTMMAMGSGEIVATAETNEQIKGARPRPAPEGLDENERRLWNDREHASLRHFHDTARLMARAAGLDSPARRGHFLRDFGQSDREVIENASSHASVPQALYLLNSPVSVAIHNANSVLGSRLVSVTSQEEKIDLVYRAMLSRKPRDHEVARILTDYETHGEEVIEDLVWILLNSPEFLFIQ